MGLRKEKTAEQKQTCHICTWLVKMINKVLFLAEQLSIRQMIRVGQYPI